MHIYIYTLYISTHLGLAGTLSGIYKYILTMTCVTIISDVLKINLKKVLPILICLKIVQTRTCIYMYR